MNPFCGSMNKETTFESLHRTKLWVAESKLTTPPIGRRFNKTAKQTKWLVSAISFYFHYSSKLWKKFLPKKISKLSPSLKSFSDNQVFVLWCFQFNELKVITCVGVLEKSLNSHHTSAVYKFQFHTSNVFRT